MRLLAGSACFLALLIAVLPDLEAQDKKDPAKDPEKKAVKKDDDDKAIKKEAAKKEKEPEVVYGQFLTVKLKRLDANSARDFTVEVPMVDPKKVYDIEVWQANELLRISRIPLNQPQNRARESMQYQTQLARKDIYTLKDVDMRASENCKIRTKMPPMEFDDKGNQKPLTKKELLALKGNSKLPGYPADFDRLAGGQLVTVYLAKTANRLPVKGENAPKKKNTEKEEPIKPEAVMIVVEQDPPKK